MVHVVCVGGDIGPWCLNLDRLDLALVKWIGVTGSEMAASFNESGGI